MTTIDIQITPKDIDFSSSLSLKSLFDSLIDAATVDANKMGFGVSELQMRGFTWIISSMAAEVERMPKIRETISVETWIERSNRIYSYRHFKIYDSEGVVIIKATSQWSAISIENRKLANITKLIDCKSSSNGVNLDINPSERILEIEANSTKYHNVAYSDIDMNGHANSSHYIEWICDSIEDVFKKISCVSRFEISYLQEAMYGEKIAIMSQIDQENRRELFLMKNEKDQIISSAILNFSKQTK